MANNLFDLAQAYLNQGMPDISGIFPPPPPTIGPITRPEPIPGPVAKILPVRGGNEEGFSVYNPDPNRTRTSRNYVNPFPFDPMDNFGTPDYGYIEEPRKGIQGLFDQYVKGSIPAQLIGKGIKGLTNMFPPNRAGIFQNELLGGGFMLDNTGKIVSNNYNTPQGIMAGYNPVSGGAINTITGGRYGDEPTYGLDKSYDKRRETVAKTLKEKYGMTDEQIQAAIAGEYTADVVYDQRVKEKQNEKRISREDRQRKEAARKGQTYTGGSDRQNVVDRNTGRRDATGGDRGSRGASDQFSNRSGRGRTGY
jgi:hypothetical protein